VNLNHHLHQIYFTCNSFSSPPSEFNQQFNYSINCRL
jgi:hypothetical protein